MKIPQNMLILQTTPIDQLDPLSRTAGDSDEYVEA